MGNYGNNIKKLNKESEEKSREVKMKNLKERRPYLDFQNFKRNRIEEFISEVSASAEQDKIREHIHPQKIQELKVSIKDKSLLEAGYISKFRVAWENLT